MENLQSEDLLSIAFKVAVVLSAALKSILFPLQSIRKMLLGIFFLLKYLEWPLGKVGTTLTIQYPVLLIDP